MFGSAAGRAGTAAGAGAADAVRVAAGAATGRGAGTLPAPSGRMVTVRIFFGSAEEGPPGSVFRGGEAVVIAASCAFEDTAPGKTRAAWRESTFTSIGFSSRDTTRSPCEASPTRS